MRLIYFEDYLHKGWIVIAIIGPKVVGYLAGIIEENMDEKFGYIEKIFILKEFRNKGKFLS